MLRKLIVVFALFAIAIPAFADDKKKEQERLGESYSVLKEILGMPEGIPKDLMDKAVCVVVYPSVKKAAFVVGGSYGRGVITCRSGKEFGGSWSAPAFFARRNNRLAPKLGAAPILTRSVSEAAFRKVRSNPR